MDLPHLDFGYLRDQIVGVDSSFETPFGTRMLVYCDYTASGRTLHFVEDYLQGLQRQYANTHTEDDITGRNMTDLLHQAERAMKTCVNAGPQGKLLAVGTGATGAIDKLQQMLGVTLPPASREMIWSVLRDQLGPQASADFEAAMLRRRPVVFVGPYEHHSNEVTWRESLAEVIEIQLTPEGSIDLEHLESMLVDPRFAGRLRIGAFSSASNVTGLKTDVHEVARVLHRHNTLATFDYAASGPYVPIDMNPEPSPDGEDRSLDAIFISPHKFLGGPGSSGILVFNERLYRRDLPPTVGGGGTVDYVGYTEHDFTEDIEEREKAGTPGVLQTLKAALAFLVKQAVGTEAIEKREFELVSRAFARWQSNDRIQLLGKIKPENRVAIISFNLRCPEGSYLHPKFVTTLANDLFGIQSRAGCSCAGPYGHRLLGIDASTSERYRVSIKQGYAGIKPGWCRVGFHYVMDDTEADFVIDAIDFCATEGHRFLQLYRFNPATGAWKHKDETELPSKFCLNEAFQMGALGSTALPEPERRALYRQYMTFARDLAAQLALQPEPEATQLPGEAGRLQFFHLPCDCLLGSNPSGEDCHA